MRDATPLRLTSTLLLLLLLACSKSPERAARLLFVGIPKLQNNPVFELAHQGAEAKAKELGVELRWSAPRAADAVEQRNIMQAAVEQRPDGIFISVNDAVVLKDPIDRAAAAGIPVVCFDADSPDSRRITCFAVDDRKTGGVGAEQLVGKMGKKGKVAILHGTAGAPNLERRIEGFTRRMKELAPDVVLLDPVFCNDNTQRAIEVVKNVIQANPDLTGFYFSGGWPLFATPPGPFLGLAPGKLTVVSFDGLPEELDYVRQGYVHALTAQRLAAWGSESVRILADWNAGKRDWPPFIDAGYDLVTKESVDAYAHGR